MVVNTSLISNLIFPVVMLVGLFLAFDGRLTVGAVSTAASMANFVITPCNQIAQCWAKVKSSKGIRQRLKSPCPFRKLLLLPVSLLHRWSGSNAETPVLPTLVRTARC